MADNINITKRGASMFSRKELPWHGLGQILNQDIVTAKEALVASHLDFNVEKKNLSIILMEDEDVETVEVINSTKHFGTYRTDTNTILGIVGKDYTVVQNEQCFDFMDTLIMGGEASFETAGALGNGERIFITAKVPGYLKLDNGDDIVEKYLFITNSHDGTGKVIVGFTPVRIVCNNTLIAALRGCKNKIAIKHTASVHDRMETAHLIMHTQNVYYDQFEQALLRLKGVQVHDNVIRKIVCKVILSTEENNLLDTINYQYSQSRYISVKKCNILDDIINTVEAGVGQEYHRGTALWLVNGLTTYYQNTREYRTAEAKLGFLMEGRHTDNITGAINYFLTQH